LFIGVVFSSKVALLYSGSLHGFEASKFHSLCDNKGPTLTIIKTSLGHTFGGYTKASWESSNSGNYKHDTSSFVFSVDKLTKYPITKDYDKAIHCDSSWGPRFGTGATIAIYDKSNQNTSSYLRPDNNYSIPKAANGESILTDGNNNF
jgi:hypothetical protein